MQVLKFFEVPLSLFGQIRLTVRCCDLATIRAKANTPQCMTAGTFDLVVVCTQRSKYLLVLTEIK